MAPSLSLIKNILLVNDELFFLSYVITKRITKLILEKHILMISIGMKSRG